MFDLNGCRILESRQRNVDNDTYLYIKSAPTKEEWEGCWYREYVGNILFGGSFNKQFSKEKAKKRAKVLEGDPSFIWTKDNKASEIEKRLIDARNFAFNGFKTIHRSDVIYLDGSQIRDFKDKLRHGDKLDLGNRENSWLTEDPYYKDR